MKKILMGAAVMAMFATSCHNEVVVNDVQSAGKGEFFTLEVGKGFESRTVLSGTATHWSEGDQIYVSGKDGKVTGVLTLEGKGGSSTGKFTGFVFGGQPSELEHIVFPVPEGGKIDMAKRDPNKLDAPMIGTIGNGAVQTLENVGGLLAFNVTDGDGKSFDVKAMSGKDNMTGGYYTFDASSGSLKYNPVDELVNVVVEGEKVVVPVATTLQEVTADDKRTWGTGVTVTVFDSEKNAEISEGETTAISGLVQGDEPGEAFLPEIKVDESGDVSEVLIGAEDFLDAVEKGGYIKLAEEVDLSKKLVIKEGNSVTINLNKKSLKGKLESDYLIENYGTLSIEGEGEQERDVLTNPGYGVKNLGIVTLRNIKVTADQGGALVGIGSLTENEKMTWQDGKPTNRMVVENCEVVSNKKYTNDNGKNEYAVFAYDRCELIMNGVVIDTKGGGIMLNCSWADLNNVNSSGGNICAVNLIASILDYRECSWSCGCTDHVVWARVSTSGWGKTIVNGVTYDKDTKVE